MCTGRASSTQVPPRVSVYTAATRCSDAAPFSTVLTMELGACADANQSAWAAAAFGYGARPARAFRWGAAYTHFWYALEAAPPFRLVATSSEWCLASRQDADDCESIQFVSGLAPHLGAASESAPADGAAAASPPAAGAAGPGAYEPARVAIAYGINDCEARIGELSLERIWRMLRPLAGSEGACFEWP